MDIFGLFRPKAEPISEEAVARARAFLPILEGLAEHPGWKLIQQNLVEMSNEAVQHWMTGVDHDTSLRLGARVKTLGEVLDLVDTRITLYRMMLETGGMENGSDPDSDGTTPFVAPQEDIRDNP